MCLSQLLEEFRSVAVEAGGNPILVIIKASTLAVATSGASGRMLLACWHGDLRLLRLGAQYAAFCARPAVGVPDDACLGIYPPSWLGSLHPGAVSSKQFEVD